MSPSISPCLILSLKSPTAVRPPNVMVRLSSSRTVSFVFSAIFISPFRQFSQEVVCVIPGQFLSPHNTVLPEDHDNDEESGEHEHPHAGYTGNLQAKERDVGFH